MRGFSKCQAVLGIVSIVMIGFVTLGWSGVPAQEKVKEGEQKKKIEESSEKKPARKDVYVIKIKDHKFSPAELIVPANKKLKLRIENLDPTPEEFESYDLNREKVVAGGKKITVFIGPLKPGTYKYFGEFHEDTAQGVIIAK